jgi:TatD DNase family protein
VIDTHAHLDACAHPPDVVCARARQAGVHGIITIGTGIDSCRSSLAIAARLKGVHAALGIHPHQASGPEAQRLDELRRLLAHDRAVAVGETGLDYFRDVAAPGDQQRLFEAQLELAEELARPVVIHNRDADDATVSTLTGFGGTVILHCFSSPGLLPLAIERGYYVSFAGNVTYPKADELRAAAERVPSDRLLAETDSPYLTPQPRRGRPNEPAYVVHTVAALAAARGESAAALSVQLEANAKVAFSLP